MGIFVIEKKTRVLTCAILVPLSCYLFRLKAKDAIENMSDF